MPPLLDIHRWPATAWREWATRLVLVAFAVMTGLAIAAMTWMSETALAHFRLVAAHAWWVPLLWTPAITCAVVYVTQRWFVGAAGSGIPQVIAALSSPSLDDEAQRINRSLYVSLKLSVGKAFLTVGGLFAGLSTGREGPSVQIGAGIMHHARRWLPSGSGISSRDLIAAGGAAGVAAAFNTPLGGVLFAIEQLARRPERRSSGLLIMVIVIAGLVAMSIHGDRTYFGAIHTTPPSLAMLWPAAVTTLCAAACGGLMGLALTQTLSGRWDHWLTWRQRHPLALAALCGLTVAAIGVATDGRSFGSGYLATRDLIESGHASVASWDFLTRMLSTWLSLLSGVPGGIFAPALAMGASVGQHVAMLFGFLDARALIALGMVAFLSAVTHAPITAAVIVMEMLAGHDLVMALLASAWIAHALSRLVSPSMYDELATVQLQRQRAPSPDFDVRQQGPQRTA